jgi:hypothetical protein
LNLMDPQAHYGTEIFWIRANYRASRKIRLSEVGGQRKLRSPLAAAKRYADEARDVP